MTRSKLAKLEGKRASGSDMLCAGKKPIMFQPVLSSSGLCAALLPITVRTDACASFFMYPLAGLIRSIVPYHVPP